MCHHKRFGVHGFWTGHGRSIDWSRIGLLIKLACLFFNGPVGEMKHKSVNKKNSQHNKFIIARLLFIKFRVAKDINF